MPQVNQKVTRCAVCKVDLKGKFVFIDDQIEQLLGDSKENLFGKPLHDFLNSESSEILDNILNVRNNYETFFDATSLTFINKQNKSFCLHVIASLNFIAGNPVNFQLIIDIENVQGESQSITQVPVSEKEMLSYIESVNSDIISDTTPMIQYFHKISQAERTEMYYANENTLDLVATSDESIDADDVEKVLARTEAIHFDYAESGKVYSFLNNNDVSSAIEKYKKAPNEFLIPLKISSDIRCMLRMTYPSEYNTTKLEKTFRQILVATGFLEKMMLLQSENADDGSVDIKFTIGFLESIKIPVFLTDSEGEIVGYNPSMKKHFSEKQLNGGYFKLLKSLEKDNSVELIDAIADYVNSSYDPDQPTEKEFEISLEKDSKIILTVLKIGDRESDRSACFVFTTKNL